MSNERNAGRPKGRKFITVSVGLTPEQLAFLTKQGGNKFLRALIEREMEAHKNIKICPECGQVHNIGTGEK